MTDPTLAAEGNAMGIFEDLGDIYSQTDLNEFFAVFDMSVNNAFRRGCADSILGIYLKEHILRLRPSTEPLRQLMCPVLGLNQTWTSKSPILFYTRRTSFFSKLTTRCMKPIIPSRGSSTRFWTRLMDHIATRLLPSTHPIPIQLLGDTKVHFNVAFIAR